MITAPTRPALGAPLTDGLSALLGRSGWAVALIVWAAFALNQGLGYGFDAVERMSNDDAMRLAEVRDLLAGQGWFDLVQRRLNPPGVLMHWSRLIDLPIAAILSVAELVMSPEAALRVTLTLWPSLLMLASMLACASAAAALGGPLAGAVSAVMFVLSPGLTVQYGAGAIDHHGAQMALMLAMLAGAMRIDGAGTGGIVAGLAAAAMTAIGMETAPHVVAGAGFVALRWALQGEPVARGARLFGLSFGAATAAFAMATTPPSTWSAPVCDAIGAGHIAAAAVGGFGLAAATRLSAQNVNVRLAVLAAIGAVAIGAIILVAPHCLTAPYGDLPERLKTEWLDRTQEAHSFVSSARAEPTAAFAIAAALLGAIAAAVWSILATSGEARWRAAAAVSVFAAACAVTVWQVRGANLAFAAAATLLPVAAVAIGRSGGWLRLGLATVGLSSATLGAAGLGIASIAGVAPMEDRGAFGGVCPVADYHALARVAPKGLALNSIFVGPFILAHTPLSATSAPYHRDIDGLTAAVDAFGGTEEAARAVAISRGASLVVVCETDGDARSAAKRNPDGFAARLFSQDPPGWLTRIDLGPDAKLRAWRVAPGG
ncbi:hypothetical protein [Methylopila sp. M107]|uniref:hypothetical protein n=1 Tax=Methylopila sp. M107 TaxID=1101190 RepID=UPI00036F3BF1|nr:hypothetical protein [Methylopila sp. M107]